jgi:hypothetical protein
VARAWTLSAAAALYRAAISGLSLYSYPPRTIDLLSQAVEALQSAAMRAEYEPGSELARLANYYLKTPDCAPDPASIRSSLCADLNDRNRSEKNDLADSLERIDDAAYHARGHGSFMEMIPLYRELIRAVESSFRFPDLDVSDWLFGFAGLLLGNGEHEEGQARLQQSLNIEALLSGAGSERIADRLRWRGEHFARRGCSSRERDSGPLTRTETAMTDLSPLRMVYRCCYESP